jgi:hypothetical protein
MALTPKSRDIICCILAYRSFGCGRCRTRPHASGRLALAPDDRTTAGLPSSDRGLVGRGEIRPGGEPRLDAQLWEVDWVGGVFGDHGLLRAGGGGNILPAVTDRLLGDHAELGSLSLSLDAEGGAGGGEAVTSATRSCQPCLTARRSLPSQCHGASYSELAKEDSRNEKRAT